LQWNNLDSTGFGVRVESGNLRQPQAVHQAIFQQSASSAMVIRGLKRRLGPKTSCGACLHPLVLPASTLPEAAGAACLANLIHTPSPRACHRPSQPPNTNAVARGIPAALAAGGQPCSRACSMNPHILVSPSPPFTC
jgi:hypothetical protein